MISPLAFYTIVFSYSLAIWLDIQFNKKNNKTLMIGRHSLIHVYWLAAYLVCTLSNHKRWVDSNLTFLGYSDVAASETSNWLSDIVICCFFYNMVLSSRTGLALTIGLQQSRCPNWHDP